MRKRKDDLKEEVFRLVSENSSPLLLYIVESGVMLEDLSERLKLEVKKLWLLLNIKKLPMELDFRLWHAVGELIFEEIDRKAGVRPWSEYVKKYGPKPKKQKGPRPGEDKGAFHKHLRAD